MAFVSFGPIVVAATIRARRFLESFAKKVRAVVFLRALVGSVMRFSHAL